MSLANDMNTLASAGDLYNTCVDCNNAYHVSTPDGFLISGYKRCLSCQQLRSSDPSIGEIINCVSTTEPYVKRRGLTGERLRVEKVWMDKKDIYQVTLKSSVHTGAVVMKLTDFYLQYELDKKKESDQDLRKSLASNNKAYYYVTYSFLVGRKKTHKRGFTAVSITGLSIFNLSGLKDCIEKEMQKKTRSKVHSVLIENWIKINKTEYNDLMSHVL